MIIVAADSVVVISAVDRVHTGAAEQRVVASLPVHLGAAREADGIKGIIARPTFQISVFNRRDTMSLSVGHQLGVCERQIDVIDECQGIVAVTTIVEIDNAGAGRGGKGTGKSQALINDDQEITSVLAVDLVGPGTTDKRVVVIATLKHIVVFATIEAIVAAKRRNGVVAGLAEGHVTCRTTGDRIITITAEHSIELGITTNYFINAFVTVEEVTLLTTDNQIVTAATTNPVIATLRDDPPVEFESSRC